MQMFSHKQTASQTKPDAQSRPAEKSDKKVGFRWSYIVLPLVLLLVSAGITIYFYGKLPDEVAYRFDSDGSPAAWLGINSIVMWAVVPQLLLTLLAIIIAYGTTRISHMFNETSAAGIKLDTILLIMSNMVVIPQLILLFAMLNIFSYNSFQTRIGFIWWIALAIIIVGLVLLSIFFIRAIRKIASQAE
jgi:uncharacterized membrane protein